MAAVASLSTVAKGLPQGWVSAAAHGAVGDGSTDDTAALQAALDATPPGGVCHLPPGVYRTSSALVVPPQVTLEGTHGASLTYDTSPGLPCVISPLPDDDWDGEPAVLRLLNQTEGDYSAASVGQRIRHLTIDGSDNDTAGMLGIDVYGFVREAVFEHVTVRNMVSDGFACRAYPPYTGDAAAPQSLRFLDCVADNNGAGGFVLAGPDCYLQGCNAQGSGYCGFIVQYAPNTQLVGCRSEWSGNHNYLVTGDFGDGQGAGGVLMSGCTSDRANFNGLLINSTGTSAHNITGCSFRRDGSNGGAGGGNYAAVQVVGATTPVQIDGLTVFPGVNDDGGGTNSPQFGIRAGTSTHVRVGSGYIHADQAAVEDLGTNTYFGVAPTVGTATGTTAAPVRTAPRDETREERDVYPLSEYGIVAATYHIDMTSSRANTVTRNTIEIYRIYVPAGHAITGAATYVTTAGTNPGGTGASGYALYTDAGVKITDSGAPDYGLFTATGWRSKAFTTPIAAQSTGVWYRLAMIHNCANGSGVTPQFLTAFSLTGAILNSHRGGSTHRRGVYNVGVTAFPSSFTVSSYGTNDSPTLFMALY